MNKKLLAKMLNKHQLYLNCKKGGECFKLEDTVADYLVLKGANLDFASFAHATLYEPDFSEGHFLSLNLEGATLKTANFNGAYLYRANIAGASLNFSTLVKADLRSATLHRAFCVYGDFTDADMEGVNCCRGDFTGAKFTKANLENTSFYGADLTNADFSGANLTDTDFSEANLTGANFTGAIFKYTRMEEANLHNTFFDKKEAWRKGVIIDKRTVGYKKTSEGVVIKLEIPKGAIVFSINGDKCRTNIAKVVDMGGHKVLHSCYDHSFTYSKGKILKVKDFCLERNIECAPGIHFFRTRKEAVHY